MQKSMYIIMETGGGLMSQHTTTQHYILNTTGNSYACLVKMHLINMYTLVKNENIFVIIDYLLEFPNSIHQKGMINLQLVLKVYTI